MSRDVRLRRLGAAICCLGALLLAAVVGPFPHLAGPLGVVVAQQVAPVSAPASVLGIGAASADDAEAGLDASALGRPDSRPGGLHRVVHIGRAVLAGAGTDAAPGIEFLLPGLVLGMVVAAGARRRPQHGGVRQHGTRAPPVRT